MRVSLSWLQEYVAVDVDVPKLVEMLDMSGTKVEAVHAPSEGIAGLVVAEVKDVVEHPNAENLVLVDLDAGSSGTTRVVCGARNFSVGDRVPLATVGAQLPELTITERKIRGETSRGMLCSAAELGVSRDHSGILVLPGDARPGDDVVALLGLDDTILELEITPNRPDCMSILGIAREVAALLDHELKVPDVELDASDEVASPVSVRIEDPEGCPRYLARYIEGVTIGASPAWMQRRLLAAGVRPISNVVDATNYVLMELGHPQHAFDASLIADNTIVVRRARPGEELATLDGATRTMHPDDVLIADPGHAVAVGGVMGGGDSEVSDDTTAIILEAAYFDPARIAFTSRRHGLRTEASARFERGADPEAVPVASARAAALITDTAGGRVASRVEDAYPGPIERTSIELRPRRTAALLGLAVAPEDQAAHLRSVGLEARIEGDVIKTEVPTFRPDLKTEIDLVEEVARLAGYDRLPSTLPPGRTGGLDERQGTERAIRRILLGLGLTEAWTTSFSSLGDLDALGLSEDHPARRMVPLENPTSDEEPAMRTTLLPGLLRAAARNLAHRAPGVALFEVARTYQLDPEHEIAGEAPRLPTENLVLAGVCCGLRAPVSWTRDPARWDFFAVKGVLESLFASMRLPRPDSEPAQGMPFHPTRVARMSLEGIGLGVMGEVHPEVTARFDLSERVVAFELTLAGVFAHRPERLKVEDLPRYPAVYLDLAVVVDEDVLEHRVERLVAETGSPEVTSVTLFDVYRGEQIPSGRKSLAYALEIRSPDKTLTEEEALAVRDRIVEALRTAVGADLRG